MAKKKRLKPTFRAVPKDRPDSNKALGNFRNLKCFKEARDKLCRGESAVDVATWIREEKGECADLQLSTVTKWARAYRKTIPPADFVQHTLTPAHKKALDKVKNGLDALEELEWLYSLQKERIGIDFQIEQSIGKLFDTTYREIRTAMDLLQAHQQLMMDLGLNKRHIGQLELRAQVSSVGVQYGADISAVLDDPKKRHRVLALGRRIQNMMLGRGEDAGEDVRGGDVPEAGEVIDVTPRQEVAS